MPKPALHKWWPESNILNCPCGSSHLVCGAVCDCGGSSHLPHFTPAHTPPPLSVPAPHTALSHFIICSPAPGCSGTSWPLWIHLLLLFSTDNWLEQWNACVPLAFETLHPVYFPEVSFLLSFLSLSLSVSLSHPFLPRSPFTAALTSPPPLTLALP